MSARQLCFFKFPRPLVQRLGKEFFESLPAAPGVYMMSDVRERILYIGQSQNLRVRLAYYKNAQPEREPEKIIRLVYQTELIRWEHCDSVEEAQVRERELIRLHHPRFNRVHNRPPTSTFFHLARTSGGFRLRVSSNGLSKPGERLIGPFRNQALCRQAFIALGRFFWLRENTANTAYDFPLCLHEKARTSSYAFATEENVHLLEELLTGKSTALLEEFPHCSDPCLQRLVETGILVLAEFHSVAAKGTERTPGLPAATSAESSQLVPAIPI